MIIHTTLRKFYAITNRYTAKGLNVACQYIGTGKAEDGYKHDEQIQAACDDYIRDGLTPAVYNIIDFIKMDDGTYNNVYAVIGI